MKEIFYFPQEGDKDAKGELVKRDPSKPHQCTKCLRGFSSPFALKQVCSLTTSRLKKQGNFLLTARILPGLGISIIFWF